MRCPNLSDPQTRKDFNELLGRLGGRPMAETDISPRQAYLGELTPEERRAYHLAYESWNRHPAIAEAHAFADSLGKLRETLGTAPELKGRPPRPIRNAKDFVESEAQPVVTQPIETWSDVEDVLHRMRAQRLLDQHHAVELVEAAKKAGLTRDDNESIMLHMDDPEHHLLTEHQQQLYEQFIKPMADELGWKPGYVHREVVGKGGFLDRLKQGKKKRQALGVGLLRTTHEGMRHRVMKVITDGEGRRTVVSMKHAGPNAMRVTAWENGKPTDLGTLHFKSNKALVEDHLAPLEKAETELRRELKTLTATKSRAEAAKVRIANINGKLAEIEARKDAVHIGIGENLNGYTFKRSGHVYKIDEAHIPEVEQHSGVRYHKDAIGTVARQFIVERQAARQAAHLENMKGAMLESGIAVRSKGALPPAGFKSVTLPNFNGYAFEPHTASVLDHFAALQRGNRAPYLGRLNDVLTQAMFSVLSVWHDFNIGNQWIIERGASSWALPQGYRRLWKTLGPAIKDVMSISPEYQRLMAKGVPFQRLGAVQADAYRAALDSVAAEFETKPEAHGLAKLLGYGPKQLGDVLRWWGRHQQSSMWTFNDITALQAIKERVLKGESEDDAIRHVYQVMPDYRVRTDIPLLNGITHPDVTWFSKWHYGLFRSWGHMAKDLLGKAAAKDRARAADQLAAVAVLSFVVYPMLDSAWQQATGNDKASVHRFGMTAIPYDLWKWSTDQKSWQAVLSSALTPAMGSEEVLQQVFNRDFYTGKEVAPYYEPPLTKAEMRVEHLATMSLPLKEISQESVNPGNVVTSQLGLNNPPSGAERRRKAFEKLRKERQEKRQYWANHPHE